MAAVVAFDRAARPDLGAPKVHGSGVERWNCAACGSPLAAWFPYLPDQVYIPIGIMEQADALPPQLHSHADSALPWLHIDDTVPRQSGTARDALAESGT